MSTPGRVIKTGNVSWGSAAAVGVTLAGFALVGIWLGEAEWFSPAHELLAIVAAALMLVVGLIGGAVMARWLAMPWHRVLVGALPALAFLGGAELGRSETVAAYNQCVIGGELMRDALEQRRVIYGKFPAALRSLPADALPRRRLLRGYLPVYEVTSTGYRLVCDDWLVSHIATEALPFEGHK